ncbi:hypothetical protein K0M31_003696 [Melipona bicolor]|uniref:Uncharacterized protein n=1 Tax=Melipona bicolor TaxID=60889 RepID=A0AA40FXE3_9HYME|nr:hypothetical protein K0M31_003696 [Melipona bicolor]
MHYPSGFSRAFAEADGPKVVGIEKRQAKGGPGRLWKPARLRRRKGGKGGGRAVCVRWYNSSSYRLRRRRQAKSPGAGRER